MDFTLSAYKQLISTLQSQGYFLQTFEEYIQNSREKIVILRHDVDRLPGNALVIASIQKEAGIKASYYFRIVKESYDEDVIRQIAEMGHEIGYHYENLSEISRKKEGRISHRRKGTDVRGRRSEVRRARARDRDPQITQIDADYLIGHRPTQTHTDVLAERLARIKMVIASRKDRGQRTEVRGQKGKSKRQGSADYPSTIFRTYGAGAD